MIELAQPWGLLALAAIPAILALYSLKPRRRTVRVSTNALWREALGARRTGFGLQRLLRDLALLLLLLATLLAAIALADPRWIGVSHARGDTVVVVDVSASMQARDGAATRLERAREGAARLIDALPDGARALVLTSGREATPRTAFEADRDVLRRALSRIEPTDTAGRPRAALELALALLGDRHGDGGGQGEVHFFTDAAFDDDVDLGAPGIVFHRVGDAARNVAIVRFDLRREIGREDRFEVLVTLRSYADAPLEVPLRVTLEREPLVDRTVALAPGVRRTLVLPARGAVAGRAEARIDVDDDLAADDVAYATVGLDEALRVLLVGPGNVYLESVFEAMPNVLIERRPSLGADELDRAARLHDVVVVDRAPVEALAPGSYLLIDAVPPALPLRDVGVVIGPTIAGASDAALVRDVDLGAVRIDRARRLAIDDGAAGVQRLLWSTETALVLAYLDGDRRLVLLGFDLLRSSLPLQAAFPLLVTRSVEWLRPHPSRLESTQIAAGVPFTIDLPRGQREVIVRRPDGEGEIHRVDRGPLVYDATARAGLYRYTIAGVHRHFAVNLTDERESDLAARAQIAPAPASAQDPEIARASRPLWPWLIALALALLAVECCVRGAPRAVTAPTRRA